MLLRSPRTPLLALGLVAVLFGGLGVGRAQAGGEVESADALRSELLRGTTPGEWRSTLRALMPLGPERVGDVVGPLFTVAEYGQRLDLLAEVGAFLAANPVGSPTTPRVLLVEYVLRRALAPDGAQFLELLKRPMEPERGPNPRRPAWDRLFDSAVRLLDASGTEPVDREAAISFLAWEEDSRADDALAALTREARRQMATASAADGDRLRAALLDALDRMLAVRFASPADAARRLEATKDLPYRKRWRHFAHARDDAEADRRIAEKYLGEALARVEGPAALAQVVSDAARFPDLLKAAVGRAAVLKPRPVPEWKDVFVRLFAVAVEPEVVLATLDLLADSGFGGGTEECCSPVAEAIHARLKSRTPADPVAVRVRCMAALGDLGSLDAVVNQVRVTLEALARREAEPQETVELVLAVGKCPGARVDELLKGFYAHPAATPDLRERLRVAVARALGREGVRRADADAAVAALTSIVEGGAAWERDQSPKVREAAVRSLGAYPRPDTARLLLALAQLPGQGAEEEAGWALQALGKMLTTGEGAHHGALALVGFLDATKGQPDMEARRVAALKRFRDLPAGGLPAGEHVPGGVRAHLAQALAGVLATGSEAERTQAARAAIDLAEPTALAPLTAWWAEQPAQRADLLRGLLEAVVRAPAPKDVAAPDGDAWVAESLATVSRTKDQAATAVEWAEALVRAAPHPGGARVRLIVAQAQALAVRARGQPGTPEGVAARLADLTSAKALVAAAHAAAHAPEELEPTRRVLVEVLEALADARGPGEEAKAWLLEAVDLASHARVTAVLQAGDRLGHRLLSEEGLRRLLSPQAVTEVERQLDVIRQALEKRD